MWLVYCRGQGMLTQGPTSDLKCKFNISSFLRLPHSSDCLICTRNSFFIVLLLSMIERWDMWGWLIDSRVWLGDRTWVLSHSYFYLSFCLFVFWSHMSCLFFKLVEHDSCCVCFFVYLFSLSPVPLTRSYWGVKVVLSKKSEIWLTLLVLN